MKCGVWWGLDKTKCGQPAIVYVRTTNQNTYHVICYQCFDFRANEGIFEKITKEEYDSYVARKIITE